MTPALQKNKTPMFRYFQKKHVSFIQVLEQVVNMLLLLESSHVRIQSERDILLLLRH